MRFTFYSRCKNFLFELNIHFGNKFNLRIASHQLALWVSDNNGDCASVFNWLNPLHYGKYAKYPHVQEISS